MNALDILLLALIGISGVMSFRVGLLREVFALGALLIGILAGVVLSRAFAVTLPDLFGSRAVSQVVLFLVVFLVVYVIVSLIGGMIARAARSIHLGWADRLLGFLFGSLRGAILGMLLIIGLAIVLPAKHPLLAGSRGCALADQPIRIFSDLLPDRAREYLQERYAVLRGVNARVPRYARPSGPAQGERLAL